MLMNAKRWIAIGALTLLLPVAASAQQAFARGALNLRAGPSGDYPLVARLAPGQPVDVMGCTSGYGWCDVVLPDGLRGWVYAPNLDYAYEDRRVPLATYGAVIGVPIVSFVIGNYWSSYYRDRPWYGDRRWWRGRPPPPVAGWRPPPPSRPDWRPQPPRPGFNPGPGYRPQPDYRPPRPPGVRPPHENTMRPQRPPQEVRPPRPGPEMRPQPSQRPDVRPPPGAGGPPNAGRPPNPGRPQGGGGRAPGGGAPQGGGGQGGEGPANTMAPRR